MSKGLTQGDKIAIYRHHAGATGFPLPVMGLPAPHRTADAFAQCLMCQRHFAAVEDIFGITDIARAEWKRARRKREQQAGSANVATLVQAALEGEKLEGREGAAVVDLLHAVVIVAMQDCPRGDIESQTEMARAVIDHLSNDFASLISENIIANLAGL